MARTIYGEARGESIATRQAVAAVIVNRAENARWWGGSIVEVCQKPYQFSCWNSGDPNRPKIEAVTTDDPIFAECLQIAHDAVNHAYPDPSRNSDSYYDLSIPAPSWARGLSPRLESGNMRFFGVELAEPPQEQA